MVEPLPRLAVHYTEGDTVPALKGVLKQTDFVGATVSLTLRRPTGVLVKEPVAVTSGEFTIEWADDDLVAGVGQEALLRANLLGGDVLTLLRFVIDVGEVLA